VRLTTKAVRMRIRPKSIFVPVTVHR
jgi:hypothetical protein